MLTEEERRSMPSELKRRKLAFIVGGIVGVATYFELAHVGAGIWYAAGGGIIAGFIVLVIVAALIC
jgi:hypothetical protein